MNNTIFLVYSCDENHTNDSKQLIGIFTTIGKAITTLKPILEIAAQEEYLDAGYEGAELMLFDLLDNLDDIKQTQSLSTNFMIEEYKMNTLNLD